MATRTSRARRMNAAAPSTASTGTATVDALEQRVVAFAERLGLIAAAIRTKAEGWMDREALQAQIASVRDGAAELLEHLAVDSPAVATTVAKKKPAAGAGPARTAGRSGGLVDAAGKKHRSRMPSDPDASRAESQAAKMRMAKTMVKTNRRRGRG